MVTAAWVEGEPFHVRMVYDGEFVRLWIDGVLAGQTETVPGLLGGVALDEMSLRVSNNSLDDPSDVLWDEAFAVLNYRLTEGGGNFTPPTQPWTLNIV